MSKDFDDEIIVQNIMIHVPERHEYKIYSLKETKDLSNISLAESVNALQTQEQRRSMRQ